MLSERIRIWTTPGSIALLHDGGGDRIGTVEAVDRTIPELQAQGWCFGRPAERGRPPTPQPGE